VMAFVIVWHGPSATDFGAAIRAGNLPSLCNSIVTRAQTGEARSTQPTHGGSGASYGERR
jgi:hypothetical protein